MAKNVSRETLIEIKCAYDKLVPLKDLNPHPKNPNKHSKDQIERLAKVIKYQGVRRPIRVSRLSNCITSGHGLLAALGSLGRKDAPVNYQDYENEDQEFADLVADNSLQSWSELDLASINLEVPSLGPDFDIDWLGIKDFEIDAADKYGDKDADDVPEVKQTDIKRGDLFQLGNHKILCGDSTVKEDVERLMNGEKAQLISTDPPYGINHVETSQEKGQSKKYKAIKNDELQDQALQDFIFKMIETAKECALDKNFAFYMWHAMKMQGYFAAAAAAAAAAGILFHRQIIWMKPQFVFGRGHYHWRHELCLMGWLKGNEPPFYGERNQDTVWQIGRENDKIHPTQKPVQITEIPIKNHTKPGELLYEPFAGSGSTLIAAEKTGRRCYAMELEPIYVQTIIDRFEKFSGIKATKL